MANISPEGAAILVVDDRPANVRRLSQVLTDAGFEVLPALGGVQALAQAQERPPELVLLDMLMPDMHGFEVCRRLHALDGLTDVPVIILAPRDNRSALIEAFAAGAVDYLAKPLVTEELLVRVHTHVALKRSRDRLRALASEREDLTNIVAHDLKNPLANIRFAAQLLQRHDLDATARRLGDDILACADEGLAFIQRYLGARERGERLRRFVSEGFDLTQLVREAVSLQHAAAVASQVTVKVETVDAVRGRGDRLGVRNVVQNLLGNAIRHSPSGAEVLIAIGNNRTGEVECQVMDRGPGISSQDQHRLFQRFARLSTAKTCDPQSTGLGLAIAKHDIAQMGGHLWYETRAGGGSTFGFVLPPDIGDGNDAPS